MTDTPNNPTGAGADNAGATDISIRTFDKLVTAAIRSVPGTCDVDSKLAGIAGRGFPRVHTQVDSYRRVLAVEASIAVTWPAPVTQVAEQVRAAIAEAARTYTDYETTRVNVSVGTVVPGERIAPTSVAARPHAAAFSPQVNPHRVWQPETVRGIDKLAEIHSPEPVRLRSIDAGSEPEVRSVSADASPFRPRQIAQPRQPRVTSPVTPEPVTPRSVQAPAPARLRAHGEAFEHWPRPVRTASSQPLRRIEIRPANPSPAHVYAPRPEPLRQIEVTPLTVRSPEIVPFHTRRKASRPQPLKGGYDVR